MATAMKGRQERLRKMLLERSRELEKRLRKEVANRVGQAAESFSACARDEGDLSNLEHEQDFNSRRISACSQNLKHISDALVRLRQATYGVCAECGAEISERRLQVVPFTPYCRDCQEIFEDDLLNRKINEWLGKSHSPREH